MLIVSVFSFSCYFNVLDFNVFVNHIYFTVDSSLVLFFLAFLLSPFTCYFAQDEGVRGGLKACACSIVGEEGER